MRKLQIRFMRMVAYYIYVESTSSNVRYSAKLVMNDCDKELK